MTAVSEELQGWAAVTEKLLRDAAFVTLCEVDEPRARLTVMQSYTSAVSTLTQEWLSGVLQHKQLHTQHSVVHKGDECAVQAGNVAALGIDHACQTSLASEPHTRHDAAVGNEVEHAKGNSEVEERDTSSVAVVAGLQHEVTETRHVQRRVLQLLRRACRTLDQTHVASEDEEEGEVSVERQAREVEWWAEQLCRHIVPPVTHTSATHSADGEAHSHDAPDTPPSSPLSPAHKGTSDVPHAAEINGTSDKSRHSSLRGRTPSVEYDVLASPGSASQAALYQRILPLPPVSRITASLLRVQAQIRELRDEPSQPHTGAADLTHRPAWSHVVRSPGPTHAARQTSSTGAYSRDMVYTPRTTTASLTPRLTLQSTPRLRRDLYTRYENYNGSNGGVKRDMTPLMQNRVSAAAVRQSLTRHDKVDLAATTPSKTSAADAEGKGNETPAEAHVTAARHDEQQAQEEEETKSEPAPSRRLAAALQAADAWQQRMRQLQDELRDLRGGLHARS